jgi:predicted transcriptional regulator
MNCLLKDNKALLYTRKIAAHKLRRVGFPQERIAGALGCSQAMVSKYLDSPPSEKYRRLHGEIEMLANDMAELMRDCVGEEGVLFYFCEHFFDWKKRGLLCNLCNKISRVLRNFLSLKTMLPPFPESLFLWTGESLPLLPPNLEPRAISQRCS